MPPKLVHDRFDPGQFGDLMEPRRRVVQGLRIKIGEICVFHEGGVRVVVGRDLMSVS